MATFGVGLLGISAAFAQQDIVTFSSASSLYQSINQGGGSSTVGYEFNVTSPITVTGLSAFTADPAAGLNVNTSVGLWDASQNLLAQATILAGTTDPLTSDGFFRYTTLSTPITLQDGTYYVGAEFTAGVDRFTGAVPGLSTMSGVTYDSAAFALSSSLTFPSFTFSSFNGFFGGNVVATPAPEPESIMLLSMGLVGVVAFGRKKLL